MFGWVLLGFVPTLIMGDALLSRYKVNFDKKFRLAGPKRVHMFR